MGVVPIPIRVRFVPIRLGVWLIIGCLLACGGSKKEMTLTVRDDAGARVEGVEIRMVGSDARLGTTDANGQVTLVLTRPKDSRLFLRLHSPEQDGRPLYLFEDEEIEITDQDLKRGRRVVPAERSAPPDSLEPQMARYEITSAPPGAQVLIDGVDKGTTPTIVSDLPTGRIHVELRLADYQPWSQDIFLAAGGETDTIVLQRVAATTASLRIDSSPKGAAVVLDQSRTAERTPVTLTDLAPGRHRVRIEKEGYEANETAVTLRAGEQGSVKLQLVSRNDAETEEPTRQPPKPPPRSDRTTYSVSAKPWALVYVDDDPMPRGESGPFTISLSAGAHRFRCVNKEAGVDVTLAHTIAPGENATKLILDWQNKQVVARSN